MSETAKISAALVEALKDLSMVEANRNASIPTKGGGNYSYSYADIGDVIRLTRPKLAEHGIIALTPVSAHESELACTVTLIHESGERLDFGPFPFPHGDTAQATGSMVTYHRRYALVAALGIAAGDDDDGASAQPRQRQQEPSQPEWGPEQDATAGALAVRWEHLPGALAERVENRIVADFVKAGGQIPDDARVESGVSMIRATGAGWLHAWDALITRAEETAEQEDGYQ